MLGADAVAVIDTEGKHTLSTVLTAWVVQYNHKASAGVTMFCPRAATENDAARGTAACYQDRRWFGQERRPGGTPPTEREPCPQILKERYSRQGDWHVCPTQRGAELVERCDQGGVC